MRPDVAHGAQLAVVFGFDAPVPVGIVKQPILGISSLDDQNIAQVAIFDDAADMLHHGIIAKVMLQAVGQTSLGG